MRIVGGEWRGRRLAAPAGRATRPTSAKVRESVFDVLTARDAQGEFALTGATVLDLFAGSGAMGLEALSRGAATCAFVERSPAALRALRRNVKALGCGDERAAVVATDARRALRHDAEQGNAYTLVLVDAPYAEYEAFEPDLARDVGTVLCAGGMAVVETARDREVRLPLRETGVKIHGDTRVTFLAR